MSHGIRYFLLGFLALIAVFSIGVVSNSAQDMTFSQGPTSGDSHQKAHMDHKPKHGGTFFMSSRQQAPFGRRASPTRDVSPLPL